MELIVLRKLDVWIFREMERRLELVSEQLIYVGDAFGLDIDGASAAGWFHLVQSSSAPSG